MTPTLFRKQSLVWLVALAVVASLDAWFTRALLNPDGAAYLDLADAVGRGEWRVVVQGYWSPLYPLLAAGARTLARLAGLDALAAVHALNAGLAVVGGVLLHRLLVAEHERVGGASVVPPRLWLNCSWAAYAICALVYARIDGVTPDLLLLVVLVALLDEMLRHGPARPVRLGFLLGVVYLAKTSSWPWLLVTWGWLASPWGRGAGSAVPVRGMLTTAGVLLAWLVPLGITSGAPTIGSTGRLNACWFLRDCDGQSPDTHRGEHARYATLVTPAGSTVAYARLADPAVPAATYLPWTDPTAWAAGVRTQREVPLSLTSAASVVLDNLADALRYLGLYLYLAALAPLLLWWMMARPTPAWTDAARRSAGMALLGTIGIAQFVAVQVQPRLMAPFAWLQVAGVLAWAVAASTRSAAAPSAARADGAARKQRKGREAMAVRAGRTPPDSRVATGAAGAAGVARALVWLPVLATLAAVALLLRGDLTNAGGDAAYRAELREASTRASEGAAPRAVVVVGEAFPLVGHAKALGVSIVAQVLPAAVPVLDALDPRERQRLLQQAGTGDADVAWQRQPDGRVRVTTLR